MTSHDHDHDHDHDHLSGETAMDPVCGMSVAIATAQHTYAAEDGTTYFCSAGCRSAFIANPDAYRAHSHLDGHR